MLIGNGHLSIGRCRLLADSCTTIYIGIVNYNRNFITFIKTQGHFNFDYFLRVKAKQYETIAEENERREVVQPSVHQLRCNQRIASGRNTVWQERVMTTGTASSCSILPVIRWGEIKWSLPSALTPHISRWKIKVVHQEGTQLFASLILPFSLGKVNLSVIHQEGQFFVVIYKVLYKYIITFITFCLASFNF